MIHYYDPFSELIFHSSWQDSPQEEVVEVGEEALEEEEAEETGVEEEDFEEVEVVVVSKFVCLFVCLFIWFPLYM